MKSFLINLNSNLLLNGSDENRKDKEMLAKSYLETTNY